MITLIRPESYDAFEQLLARPDAPDLPRRAHVFHYAGDPDRRTTRFPLILMAWLQRRHLQTDGDEPLAAARRSWTQRAGADVPARCRLVPVAA
jgi:hypothetical protein